MEGCYDWIINFVVVFQKISLMNSSGSNDEDFEGWLGFSIEGIVLPVVACLGIAGEALISTN